MEPKYLLMRVALVAIAFSYIFPVLTPGVQFHGNFWPDAFIWAAVLAVIARIVAFLMSLFFAFTLGLGGLVLLFFFWLVPAFQLYAMAAWFPQVLTLHGLGDNFVAGLILMVIYAMTNPRKKDES
jgi:hypothetical protein